jgi:hypothetical protein
MSANGADTLAVLAVRGSLFFTAATADHVMHLVVGPRTLPVMGMIINTANGADFRTVNGMIFELGLTTTVTFQGMASRTAFLEHPVMDMFLFCGQHSGCHTQNDGKSQYYGKQYFDMLLHFVPSFVELPGSHNFKRFLAVVGQWLFYSDITI